MNTPAPFILGCVLLLGASGAAQDTGRALQRPRAGFEIVTPALNWVVQESGQATGNGFQLVLAPPNAQGKSAVTVRVGLNGPPMEANGYRDALLDSLSSQTQYSGLEKISRALAGRQSPGLALDTESSGLRFRVRQYVLVEQGFRYTVQCHAPVDEFETLEPAFERAFAGFAFLPLSDTTERDRRLDALAARCGSEWDWAETWEKAAQRAQKEKRLVLVYGRFYPGFSMTDAVMSGPLMDVDVVALVKERFVPLRLYPGMPAPFRDPEVYGLGGSTFGQAVLVAAADGEILADDSLLKSKTLLAALERGLERAKIDLPAAEPAKSAAEAALNQALEFRRQHLGEEALRELRRLADDPDLPWDDPLRQRAAAVRGTVLLGLGRNEQAEAAFAELLDTFPDSPAAPEARFHLASCLLQRGEREQAESTWLALTEDLPDNRWAWRAAATLRGTFFEQGIGADLSWPDPVLLEAVSWRESAPLPLAKLEQAEAQAVAWLLAAQRADGSWAGPSELSGVKREADDVFTVAFTALAGRALLERAERNPDAGDAAERALGFLFAAREREKEHEPQAFFMDYTPWSKAASLQFMLDCLEAGLGDAETTRGAAAELVGELADKQKPSGGWSYYLSGSLDGAARPAPQSMSFTTAAVMLALLRAERAGLELPPPVRRAGLDSLENARNDNGTFEYMVWPGQEPGDRNTGEAGAAGRGPVCCLALLDGGRETLDDLRRRLELYAEHLDELRREQGKGLMHGGEEGQGSHYLMFDYATAAEAIARLPKSAQRPYRRPLLEAVLATRREDGSFCDNPIIGPAAGTALALTAFHSLRR